MVSMSAEFVVTLDLDEVQVRCGPTNPPGGDPEERVVVIFTTVPETNAALRSVEVLGMAGASIRIVCPVTPTVLRRLRLGRFVRFAQERKERSLGTSGANGTAEIIPGKCRCAFELAGNCIALYAPKG